MTDEEGHLQPLVTTILPQPSCGDPHSSVFSSIAGGEPHRTSASLDIGLNPIILPNEILGRICQYADTYSLLNVQRSSQLGWDLATPIIYHTIRLESEMQWALFDVHDDQSSPHSPSEICKADDTLRKRKVFGLIKKIDIANSTACTSSRVRSIMSRLDRTVEADPANNVIVESSLETGKEVSQEPLRCFLVALHTIAIDHRMVARLPRVPTIEPTRLIRLDVYIKVASNLLWDLAGVIGFREINIQFLVEAKSYPRYTESALRFVSSLPAIPLVLDFGSLSSDWGNLRMAAINVFTLGISDTTDLESCTVVLSASGTISSTFERAKLAMQDQSANENEVWTSWLLSKFPRPSRGMPAGVMAKHARFRDFVLSSKFSFVTAPRYRR